MNDQSNWRTPSAPQIGQLMNVALGKEKADLVIANCTLLNVHTGELLPGYSVAVKKERIAFVGPNAQHTIGPGTRVIDAAGATLIPGLIDAHIHLVYYYTPYRFLSHAMAGGTTTVITELLEIVFYLGYKGAVTYLASLKDQPIKVLATAPPLVTISPAAEARAYSRETLAKLLSRPDIVGLGETYWLQATQGNPRLLNSFAETLKQGKKLSGHAAGARGEKLEAYAAGGVSNCHESVSAEEALDKLRLGLHVIAREGSMRRDLAEVSKIMGQKADLRRLSLGTDSITPDFLLKNGYMECIVQRAIELGWPPVRAIQMATINAAECFGLDDVVGAIAPGKHADMVLIPDLKTIKAQLVVSKGRVIARDGQLLVQPRRHDFPGYVSNIFKVGRPFTAEDFVIPAPASVGAGLAPARQGGSAGDGQAKVRVIDFVTDLVTKESQVTLPIREGVIKADVDQDILKVMMMDAFGGLDHKFIGLVKGFRMKKGAIASSQVWDCAGLIVLGSNEREMAMAANRVIELKGGIVVCAGGRVQAELPLPIAGFMCDLPMEDLAQKLANIQLQAAGLGCPFPDAHLSLTILTTPAIPHLRICEAGLVNIRDGKILDLLIG